MNKTKQINVLIAGGSGFWAECNHFPSIIKLKKEKLPLRVIAICDTRNPYREKNRPNLSKVLKEDKPLWINPSGLGEVDLENKLNEVSLKYNISTVIVATNPTYHFFYAYWATKNAISVLCDKPLVTISNASFSVESALQIQKNYELLKAESVKAKQTNPRYLFCSPLRRRVLTPFVKIAEELSKVYRQTGEGIRYMNIIVNGGVHKYPQEFLKGGAHGYLDGVGSLAHSSYHYIDVIAWYLSIAKGNIVKIEITLPYVLRVRDYLRIKGYKKLRELIEKSDSNFKDDIRISNSALNSELDFTFYLKLFDEHDALIGLISYVANHTTFSPRLTKYEEEMVEYTNDKFGGRMSQVYFDIHQGAVQNWQLIKNDVVFFGNNIYLKGRKHPRIGKPMEEAIYEEAYEKGTITPQDLFMSFIKYTVGYKVPAKHLNLLSAFDNQNLTNRIFSKFYEKLAEDFQAKNGISLKTKISSVININDYL